MDKILQEMLKAAALATVGLLLSDPDSAKLLRPRFYRFVAVASQSLAGKLGHIGLQAEKAYTDSMDRVR